MPITKKTTADAFFALQLVLALISGGSEFRRLLSTTQGVNLSWLASWLAFLLINLALTIRAHRRQPSRVTLQAVLTYAAWTTVIAACLGAMLWNGTDLWDAKDTLTAILVALGSGYHRAGGLPAGPGARRPPGARRFCGLLHRPAATDPDL